MVIKFLINLIKIVITLVLLFFIGGIIKKDLHQAKLRTLNHAMPKSYGYLLELNKEGDRSVVDGKIKTYVRYYSILGRLMPQLADSHAMLGFCHFYQGNYSESIESYQRAVNINSHNFWWHYNLGVAFVYDQQYEMAIESFQSALRTNPSVTLKIIGNSKVFRPILLEATQQNYNFLKELKEGFKNCKKWIALSQYQLQQGTKDFEPKAVMRVHIF